MLKIAHRGASGHLPENTLRAFRGAIEDGAEMCELDVRLSRDGALVVIHDETVDRTTDGTGVVAEMTLEELRRLDAGVRFGEHFRGERIATLDEVFAAVAGRAGLNIELKSAGVEAKVCELIETRNAADSTLVSSFEWDALTRVRGIAPQIRVGLLASAEPVRLLSAAIGMRAYAINPDFEIVTEDLCIAAHKRGLNVYTWTVDEPAMMRQMVAYGVDGIMTNYPRRLAEVMDW